MKRRADTGKWEVRWRENGRNRSRSFSVKADAARFELGVRRARELGGPLDLDRGRETVADFMERWWRDYAVPTLSDNTRACYAGIWERHVRGRIGGYRLRDVTPAVVARLNADLTKDGVGSATIHKALAIVSGMFRHAVIWDRVDRNPVREIKLPRATRQRFVRPLAPVTVEAMRARLLEAEQLRDATLLAVLAYAGLRPEEARALRWEDVGERTIRVERAAAGSTVKETKTGEIRTVRLLAPLARDVGLWRERCGVPASGLVFPTSRGTVWTDFDWRNWRRRVYRPTAEGVGLTGSRPYDLRHSFASLLIHEGVSVIEVARQVGNSPDVTLTTYAHVFEEFEPAARVSAVDAIEAARAEFDVRGEYAETLTAGEDDGSDPASMLEADARTRTGDPFITSEVLYQLSYVGRAGILAGRGCGSGRAATWRRQAPSAGATSHA